MMHPTVEEKLNYFLHAKKIPNIIFHGSSGSGKRTIVQNFLTQIYGGDHLKIKRHVMFVNCSEGKGIKFIRNELKFFAKTNIHSNNDVLFKSIVLLNADSLTTDAQSALRRCIELFSHNTRFFIVVENKHKLLNPILSRFCEIYVPELMDSHGNCLNLHKRKINQLYSVEEYQTQRFDTLQSMFDACKIVVSDSPKKPCIQDILHVSNTLYEMGYSAMDIVEYYQRKEEHGQVMTDLSKLMLYFYELKDSFRCEKMLIFFILSFIDKSNVGKSAVRIV
jgi:hypothetical protein